MRPMVYFLEINFVSSVAIFFVIVMLLFSLVLLIKNRKLQGELENLKLEDRNFLKKKCKVKEEDIVSINNISKKIEADQKVKKIANSNSSQKKIKEKVKPSTSSGCSFDSGHSLKKEQKKMNDVVHDSFDVEAIERDLDKLLGLEPIKNTTSSSKEKSSDKKVIIKNDSNRNIHNSKEIYTKNVLQDIPKITSPIGLDTQEFDMNSFGDNLNEFVRSNKKGKRNKKEDNYLGEVSKKIAQNLEPQTIELTDYEKEQEENAIISYKELINVKGKVDTIDENESGDFIEELKNFRNSLD